MWFQFSLTVVLAVGLAVKYGPGTLLAETSEGGGGQQQQQTAICSCVTNGNDRTNEEREEERQRRRREQQQQRAGRQRSDGNGTRRSGAINAEGRKAPSGSFLDSDKRHGTDSGYGSIAFVEMLGPGDFEGG